ncbi:MAG TPA: hypothetical protein VHV49_19355 [Pseudonocardiaceae bacterium]|nr:hypothetical protein [Pseudonocardiaceae bacterium]
MKTRTWVYVAIGVVLILVGLLWVFQGLGTISGGFMSGSKVWFAIGLLVAIGGVASVYTGVRGKPAARR